MYHGLSLTINLPDALARFAQEQASSGQYSSVSEVVSDGLRLLAERKVQRDAVVSELRRQIAEGAAAADRGDVVDAESVFDEIATRGQFG